MDPPPEIVDEEEADFEPVATTAPAPEIEDVAL
jgi:hypothetical protein